MTNCEILTRLGACFEGLACAAESPTLREWWETSTTRTDMTWLLGRAHSQGTLPRRRLVAVAVRCAETVAHLMPAAALPMLADVGAWAQGADDIDLAATRDALWEVRRADDAAYAAYAAAAHYYAAAAAAGAAAYAADAADATCDVIRGAITIDEICAALGLDPDQGVA